MSEQASREQASERARAKERAREKESERRGGKYELGGDMRGDLSSLTIKGESIGNQQVTEGR